MRLSIISDEISRDPSTAAEVACEWGLKHLELRSYYGTRAPRGMSEADMTAVAKAAGAFGLDVPSISPGLFKIRLDDPDIEDHRGALRVQCLDMAEMLGAKTMVVFPYLRMDRDEPEDRWPPEMVADFQETAELAAERGITVAVENEPICYAATGGSMARLLDEIDRPNCGANWDAANVDADGSRSTVPPGDGEVDWPGQIRALIADGYAGLVVVETHFTPRVAGSRACVAALRSILNEAGEAPA